MRHLKKIPISVYFVVLFLISIKTLLPHVAPSITAGDSAELALAGSTLGVPHSPGYPLFSLTQKIVGERLYFGNPAYRQNLCSLLFLSGGLVFLGFIFFQWGKSPWLIFLPLLLWGSPLIRHHAYVTEVFPLALLMAMGLTWLTLTVSSHKKGSILIAFIFGLSVSAHQTLLFLGPGIGYFLIRSRGEKNPIRFREWWSLFLFFMVGFSIHLFILFRSMAEPVLDWEGPETLSRF